MLVKIPTKEEYPDIQINEPWTSDGKASANALIVVQIIDTRTGEDVTDQFREKPVEEEKPKSKQGRKKKV
jgi:hypothetical protein